MLNNLAEKVDRVGERVGTEGLDALERQVMTLVHKIETPHALDPAMMSLERTMADLTKQVEALRMVAPNEESIERVTRTAVTETLKTVSFSAGGTGGGDVGLLRESLADMQARQIASDERLGMKLEGVQSALDRLADRLNASERGAAATTPSLDERLLTSTSVEAVRPADRVTLPVVDETSKADPFLEALRISSPDKPTSSLATATESAAPASPVKKAEPAASDADIKTSFIAAARRPPRQPRRNSPPRQPSIVIPEPGLPSARWAKMTRSRSPRRRCTRRQAPNDKLASDSNWSEKSWIDKAMGAKGAVGKGIAAQGTDPKPVTVKTADSAFDIKLRMPRRTQGRRREDGRRQDCGH